MDITQRQLILGPYRIAGDPAGGDAPYVVAGRRMYALGYGSTRIGPIGDEHLVGLMGGIWAHPARVADGLELQIRDHTGAVPALANARLTEQLNSVRWEWQSADLTASRHDWVLPDAPIYLLQADIHNTGAHTISGSIIVGGPLGFLGCWFGGIACGNAHYRRSGMVVLGEDGQRREWGIALGAAEAPDSCTITPAAERTLVELAYHFTLKPGERFTRRVMLAVGLLGGAGEAEELWHRHIHQANSPGVPSHLPAGNRPQLTSEYSDLTRDAALAQANLDLLSADYPDLGRYFLAGLPEYPQLFGCDTTYSVPGAAAAGFAATAGAALKTLARYAAQACGRVPHELTTNGRIFNPGNIQETPQFTIALWDYLRWTGDLDLARELFPLCREGMTELLPAHGGKYPFGDGMVERMGMGSRKLDSACYTIAGLRALAQLAHALDEPNAATYSAAADRVQADFERDWWLEDAELYADSMHSDGSLQLDGHWTVVLPIQLGIAGPERAQRVMERLEHDFVNQWGLVHTRGDDERVWTLPTGLMALAAFRQGRAERGLALTQAIAATTQHGTLGCFKELIPEGLCFVQLWSAALYLQAIYEGLLGLNPDATAHCLHITPCMPAELPAVQLTNLVIGTHTLDLTISPRGLHLRHLHGSQPLAVTYSGTTDQVAPGETLSRQLDQKGGEV